MKRLYFVVEGETELEFINRLLIPWLINRGIRTHIQGIPIEMRGGGHGFNNIEHFVKTIRPLLLQSDEPVITTMIDHYGINSERKLPGCSECMQKTGVEDRIACMERSLVRQVERIIPDYRFFIPFIMRHEMETLLFADPEKGFELEDISIRKAVMEICTQFSNIEDINCTQEGAPSRRLEAIYKASGKNYNKKVDGVDIAELTGIESILEKSPKFKRWTEQIISMLTTG